MIVQIDPSNRHLAKQFLRFPFGLYAAVSQWVPPLETDARQMLDRQNHPFYKHSEAAFFVARRENGSLAGRLAVLNNHRYNDFNHEKAAFFYLFECENDPAAARELFEAASQWARQRGLEIMIGPKGFTALDGMGLLIKGFEHRPAFGIPYNLSYYPALLEAAGFQAEGEVVSGYLSPKMEFPEKIHQVAGLVMKKRGLQVARFDSRRDLLKIIPKFKAMYNGVLEGTTGNVPLTDEEVNAIARQLLLFADVRLIKIIMKDELPVGFLFAYPDISAAVQRCQGKFLPLGWADMLLEMRRTKWININGAGILDEYRGMGGTALLFSEMYKSVVEGGFEHAELVQIGVDNTRMQNELRNLGVDFYKTHAMYKKSLLV